ncbi:hypothetical protein [Nocardia sp. NBC_01009]|uniref:hypothetical protein n=1 Tax=Nocardia sp. NBC_01009 TaxID=2975996 RepID=UPI00386D2873|nr:hypothetical protein OHA42_31875 [Nocardia sp. NBC_01009]
MLWRSLIRPGLARNLENRCYKRGTSALDDGVIALVIPKIRRLPIAFFLTRHHLADHIWSWPGGDAADNTQPVIHYRRRGHPLTRVPLQC